jgi:hypothetical protein
MANIENIWTNGSMPWVDLLVAEAEKISTELEHGQLNEINLESKVVLAMTIRLIAESFMENGLRAREANPINGKNRFGKLYDAFRKQNLGTDTDRALLNKVSLMTPEQIHLNSFMYEPLVDMSVQSLHELYKNVVRWNVRL